MAITSKPKFVPVTVIPSTEVTSIEVRCPSGHVVSVPMHDGRVLRQLFEALTSPTKEASSC